MKTIKTIFKNNAFLLMLSIFCIPIGAMENIDNNEKKIINENGNVTYSQKELDNLLFKGIQGNDIALVKSCLDKGANINAKDQHGRTALHFACECSKTEMVKLLLACNGIDINAKDNYGWTTLHIACQGNAEIVKLLLACNGIDINAKDNKGWTTLHIACQGNAEIVTLLLACNGIDIYAKNDNGYTVFHCACEYGLTEVVQLLLVKNEIDINNKDKYGQTVLHYACRAGNTEIVKLLLACNGIDINAKDDKGRTALQFACFKCNPEIVKLLLGGNGIDINAKNDDGWTALHFACINGFTDIVKLLVENGINILARDNSGRTALNIAFNNDIRTYLTNVENQLTSFINDPFALTPCLSNTQLTKIIYNLGKADISYKALMYWFSKIYLNPELMNIGKMLDACEFNEFNKNDKSLMLNAHNFLNSSKEWNFYKNLMRKKEPYAEFDLNFIYY